MDTQKTKKVSRNKALIALTAAFSCLVIYIFACVWSPVTWSPGSSKIAILVTPPGEEPDHFAIFTYDISTGERVLLDEVKADGVLSAPAWAPDGKWIAYYRVEPSPSVEPVLPPHTNPNSSASTVKSTEQTTLDVGVKKCKEKSQKKVSGEELFSEENKVLPYFLFDIIEEGISEEAEETFDVKLMIVSPNGKERKVLASIQFNDDSDARKVLMIMQPEWSEDSKTLFYARLLDTKDLYYIGSLNIDADEAYAHLFSSTGGFSLSPDGKWIASLLKNESDEFLLNIARVDGTMQKYFKLDLKIDEESLLLGSKASWSRDSKYVVITAEDEFGVIDTNTGKIQKYSDPNTEEIAWGTFSPAGDKLYYIASYELGEPNSSEEKMSLSSVTLDDRKTVVTTFLPKFKGLAQLSLSPNGKMFLLRGTIEDEHGNEKSALIFWDGKTQQVIKTDHWLKTPLYTDDDLIFEEKLIGEWIGKDGGSLVLEGTEDMTYSMTATDEDGEEHHLAANLVKLNDMLFLATFWDESVLQEKKSQGLYLFPDMLMKIDEIEPKLLLREVDHDEISELLDRDPNSLKQETEKADYHFIGIRVQQKVSNTPEGRK